jgi:uncharacterized protein (DUF488 family)
VLQIWTIGHSNHSYDRFLDLLREAGITAIADVRTAPFSRRFPHFNADGLCASPHQDGIAYVSLGKQLGGRPASRALYAEGVADYEAMATTKEFREGLERVIDGAHRHRIALMCSEQDPLDCHRCLLIGRALSQRGVQVDHLLADSRTMSHSDIEQELLRLMAREGEDLLMSRDQRLAAAYRERALKMLSRGGLPEQASLLLPHRTIGRSTDRSSSLSRKRTGHGLPPTVICHRIRPAASRRDSCPSHYTDHAPR